MNKPPFTTQEILTAIRQGECRDMNKNDFSYFADAPEGSVLIEKFENWLVIVGGGFQIEAFGGPEGEDQFMLINGEWNSY